MMIKGIYRPYKQATVPAWVAARSVGHYQVGGGWRDNVVRKDFVQMFWGIRGQGRFVFGDREHLLEPEQVCFYFPGDVHVIAAESSRWEYRWLTFDGKHMEQVITAFDIVRDPRWVGPCPENIFVQLENELKDFSPSGQYAASATVYRLLTLGASNCSSGRHTSLSERYKKLVRENFADPELTVASLSEMLHVHRTTLHRIFHQETGVSPGEYLVSFRIQEALSLLKSSDYRIGEIAEKVGIPDPNYFAKVIKKATGVTPGDFKKL